MLGHQAKTASSSVRASPKTAKTRPVTPTDKGPVAWGRNVGSSGGERLADRERKRGKTH